MKLFELAKDLGVKSTVIKDILNENGEEIKSFNTILTEEQIEFVKYELSALSTITVEETVIEEAPKKKKDSDYRPDEMIPCRSVYPGVLIFTGDHTKMNYTFNGIGDRRMIEYQDLKAGMLQAKPSMFKPLFIIEDYDLICDDHWAELKAIYDGMYEVKDLEKMLSLPNDKFKQQFSVLPVVAKEIIKTIVATKIEDGTFENYNKAKIIDEICGTRFDLKM